MDLLDVNVLLYAHREAAPQHAQYREWLEERLATDAPIGIPDLVLSGFLRIATHPRIFSPPSTLDRALEFAETLRSAPARVGLEPGPGHWEIFVKLCRGAKARGNLVADAYLAALAIEWGATLLSTDRDFTRFPGLRWKHPLEPG
jgi:toxin-antitoxin system PIN domain toxin